MRTTVKIDDRLLVEAKTRAARSGRTLNQVVEDALREAFARRDGPAAGRSCPSSGAGGSCRAWTWTTVRPCWT